LLDVYFIVQPVDEKGNPKYGSKDENVKTISTTPPKIFYKLVVASKPGVRAFGRKNVKNKNN
jgi:hypothetical protein